MFPRLLLATSTVAVVSAEVLDDFDEVVDPPPHAASERAASAAAATDITGKVRRVKVIFAPFLRVVGATADPSRPVQRIRQPAIAPRYTRRASRRRHGGRPNQCLHDRAAKRGIGQAPQ